MRLDSEDNFPFLACQVQSKLIFNYNYCEMFIKQETDVEELKF